MAVFAAATLLLLSGFAHAQADFASEGHLVPIALLCLLALFAWAGIANFLRHGSIFGYGPPQEFMDPEIVGERAAQSRAILSELSKHDDSWDGARLKSLAKTSFARLFTSISNQTPDPLRKLLRDDLLKRYERMIISGRETGVRQACEHLAVESVEIVLVRAYHAHDQDEFTAWVRARASRYRLEDGQKPTRSEKEVKPFEHFLSFQRTGDSWMLCRVEEAHRASHLLRTDNVAETLPEGWQKKAEEQLLLSPSEGTRQKIAMRAGRASAMLARLSESEAHWEMGALISLVKETYADYYACLSGRDFSKMARVLSPQFYEFAKSMCLEMKRTGIQIDARQLSVRDVDIVLVKNRQGGSNDEFTAHVFAHAQVVQLNPKGQVIGGDSAIRQFEEYLTFIHHDGWILEEMVLPGRGNEILSESDVDEGSLPPWANWYYKMLPPDKIS